MRIFHRSWLLKMSPLLHFQLAEVLLVDVLEGAVGIAHALADAQRERRLCRRCLDLTAREELSPAYKV